MILIPMIF